MSLNSKMISLADGFRKRFKKDEKLSLDDMIKLITPSKNPLLVAPGKFMFTNNAFGGGVPTSLNGDDITGSAYIVPRYFASGRSVIHDPKTRPTVTMRLHFDVTSTDGSPIKWGVYGGGLYTDWSPSIGDNVSDFKLPQQLNVNDQNSLEFDATSGHTIINLATSYIELLAEE